MTISLPPIVIEASAATWKAMVRLPGRINDENAEILFTLEELLPHQNGENFQRWIERGYLYQILTLDDYKKCITLWI